MADGPEAYYRLEETAGATNAVDSSDNAHHSKDLMNVVFGATGRVGRAAALSNGRIDLNLQLQPAAGDYSIEALAWFDSIDTLPLNGTGAERAGRSSTVTRAS